MVLRVRPCLHQQLCLICHFYTQATIILQNQGLGTTLFSKNKLSWIWFLDFDDWEMLWGCCLPLIVRHSSRALSDILHFILAAESPVAVVLLGWCRSTGTCSKFESERANTRPATAPQPPH